MTALPAVRGCDDASGFAPGFKDTLDRRGREVGAVCEDDDRDLDFVSERSEPAPKRRSRSASPLMAAHDPARARLWLRDTRLELVGALDDDDLVDRGVTEAGQNAGEEQALLWSAEPRCLAGREDDRGDLPH